MIKIRDKKIAKPSWLALIIAFSLSVLVITFGLFIVRFHNYPLSNNPVDWYNFIPIVVGVVNLIITGVIAWQVQTINKKNSRRNSVLQFLGEIYIDLDNYANKFFGEISRSLVNYNFEGVDVQRLMDEFENELIRLKPKCIAFYDKESSDSFSLLFNAVRDFNFYLRDYKDKNELYTYEDLFREQDIIDTYVLIDRRAKRTRQMMRKYMND